MMFHTLKACHVPLQNLNLQMNQFGDDFIQGLARYLEDDQQLQYLQLAYNNITDKGVETLSNSLIGNTTLIYLGISGNHDVTDESIPFFVDLAKGSLITQIECNYLPITDEKLEEIYAVVSIPVEKREIPIKSNTKSAAKLMKPSA